MEEEEEEDGGGGVWVIGGAAALLALYFLGRAFGLGGGKSGEGDSGESGEGDSGEGDSGESGEGSGPAIIEIGVYGCKLNGGAPGACAELCERILQGELGDTSNVSIISVQGSQADVSGVIDCLNAIGVKHSLEKE